MAKTCTNEELSRMVDEISEALNNKMDWGGENVQSPAFLPVKVWNNDNKTAPQWGIKYSNGMIMAQGIFPENETYGGITINFMEPFTKYYSLTVETDYGDDADYNMTADISQGACYNAAGVTQNHELSSFMISGFDAKNWFACGF